jgi:hypothetical protein
MQNIPLTQYIAQNNYNAAEHIVMANGFNKPENPQQTLNALNYLLINKGEVILDQLADAHPDYELIEKRVELKNKSRNGKCKMSEEKSNANGREENQENADGRQNVKTNEQRRRMFIQEMQIADEKTSNLDGAKVASNDDKLLKMMIIGSATILAGILIYKIA